VPGTNEAALRAAVAAFNDPGRRERYLDLYTPDVVLHGYPGNAQGREGVRSFCSQLWAAFPDIRLSIDELIASEDRLASRYTLTGTQAADFYGAPVGGGQTEVDGVGWFHFRDGVVVEAWQVSAALETLMRFSARAAKATPRTSASAAAAALRWEEKHPDA